MASSLRAKALAAKDIKTETLDVPQWDCTFAIRGLTGAQRAVLIERATVKATNGDGEETSRVDSKILNPLLIVASCYDPASGEQVFQDADADALDQKSAEAIDLVTSVILRINGMTKDENKALEKNSSATGIGAGASASPSN